MKFDQLQPDKRKEIEREVQTIWDIASSYDKWVAPFDIIFEKVKNIKDIETFGPQKFIDRVNSIINTLYVNAVKEMNELPSEKWIDVKLPDGKKLLTDPKKHSLGDAVYVKTKETFELSYIQTISGKKVYGTASEK